MFFYIYFAAAFKANDFIDGLKNVHYTYNSQTDEIEIDVTRDKISLYFEKSNDVQIKVFNLHTNKSIENSGYRIPVNSKITVKAEWTKYNDYICGFFNEENCDYVYYSKSAKSVIPLYLYYGKKMCIYHMTKDSDIKIGSQNFKKVARIIANSEFVEIRSDLNKLKKNEKVFIKNNKNILSDADDDDIGLSNQNKFTYALGFIFVFAGAFLYLLVGFVLGSDMCKCCKCKRCPHDKLVKYFDNRDNAFYTATLAEYNEIFTSRHSEE